MDRAWADLGLSPGASQDSIKQAYRKLVLQYHPDRHASSSKVEQEAAAARFKVITEAYDLLTDERARAAYHTSASRSSARAGAAYAYHHNVNTDWTHSYYNSNSSGYTSTVSRWEWYQRLARAGVRSFGQTLHLSLAVLLVGGGLLFEYSHTTLWQVRNKGKSFEEMQQAIKAQQESKAAAAAQDGNSTSSSIGRSSAARASAISSAWADGMRGRFVDSDSSSSKDAAPSGS